MVRLNSIQREGETLYQTLRRVYTNPRTVDAVTARLNAGKSVLTKAGAGSQNSGRLLFDSQVQAFIDSLYSPVTVQEGDSPIGSESTTVGGQVCSFAGISSVVKTNEIVNAHIPLDSNTYPSAVVQSKFFQDVLAGNSIQSLVGVPPAFKNQNLEFVCWSCISTPFASTTSASLVGVVQAVKTMYDGEMGGSSPLTLHVDWDTSDNLHKLVREWSLNANVLKKIDAHATTPLSAYRKKALFFMQIEVANAELLLPASPLDALFNPLLTLVEAKAVSGWGPANPPAFVRSASYGMYAVLSADWNSKTESVFQLLDAANNNVPTIKWLFS